MTIPFDWAAALTAEVAATAAELPDFQGGWVADVLPAANPKFGDFQANGVLALAKQLGANPRALGGQLLAALQSRQQTSPVLSEVELSLAGPGFLNFALRPAAMLAWLHRYAGEPDYRAGFALEPQRTVVVDYPSPNTAKQMHIGHLRPMVIGEAVSRLVEFSGAHVIRDNHLGDWGTNFGTLIAQIKREGVTAEALAARVTADGGTAALAEIERLYKDGTAQEGLDPTAREVSRGELAALQQGDPTNTALWECIVGISAASFAEIYAQLGIQNTVTLGESFYRDQVERVYRELQAVGLAEESQGALVVWHDEVPRFARDNDRPNPFTVRKQDGASNYASTDLATVLYRVEHFHADEVVYVTDDRQQDHFEQLFLTTQKWFSAAGYRLPKLRHVMFGKILGEDKRPIKTRSGESVKLAELLAEARSRALAVVAEKNPTLSPAEQASVAEAVGLGALKYADLSSNRTQDYVFSWEKLLSFEGNTAPYLLYAGARIHSIFRKTEALPTDEAHFAAATPPETAGELALARKLIAWPGALRQALADLRPHFLCTYLYELAGQFSTFYTADHVMVPEAPVRARRLLLCARTLATLETGLRLLNLQPVERM